METLVSEILRPRLGDVLLRNRLVSEKRLKQMLKLQSQQGGRIGELMIGQGMIGFYDLYRSLAHCHGLAFIDLLKHPPEEGLARMENCADYLRLQLIPWREDSTEVTIAVCDLNEDALAWIKVRYGAHARLVMTSPLDIRRTVEQLFGESIEKASCLALWRALPHASARVTLSPPQRQGMLLLGMALSVLTLYAPLHTALGFILFCQVTYMLTIVFKCWVFAASPKRETIDWAARLATLSPQELPVYTVLVPMYKEAQSLPGMLSALQAMEYPAHKLDIKLVLEHDDTETLEAACALKPRYHFDIIRVPPGAVRTKPKACNYALRFARGDYVTVFDADDHPDCLQLQKAVYMFKHAPREVVCLQARLNYYNAQENMLTRFFSLEYSTLFNVMLPGLERLSIPIPLGGTSNHIALDRLLEEGEWDPYNVTEDADLGTRFAARGYRTLMMDSVTMEEAPSALCPWIRQRSRWIKGYMQTWLVHMRHPVQLQRTLGWKGFIGFQFFVGLSTFTFLSAPVVWAFSLVWLGGVAQLHQITLPAAVTLLTAVNFSLNLASLWWFTLSCAADYSDRGPMRRAALLYPLYMLLHSIASYKALWQLIFRPHFWEKTTHGLAGRFAKAHLRHMLGDKNA